MFGSCEFNAFQFDGSCGSVLARWIEEAVVALLTGDGDVAALVGSRVYPHYRPQSSGTLPAVYYRLTDRPYPSALRSGNDLVTATFALSAYAPTAYTAAAIRTALKTLLNGFRGTVGEVEITATLLKLDRLTKLDNSDGDDAVSFKSESHYAFQYRVAKVVI